METEYDSKYYYIIYMYNISEGKAKFWSHKYMRNFISFMRKIIISILIILISIHQSAKQNCNENSISAEINKTAQNQQKLVKIDFFLSERTA